VIVPDVNLLLYAINADSPHHDDARDWFEAQLSGTRPVGLTWIVVLAFLRLTTRPGIFASPLSHDDALAYVDEWLRLPVVRMLTPTESHWGILQALLRDAGTAGNLSSDAHLAAIAIGHAATVASADHDFRRFTGLSFVNPLAG
jgi:toxin-antitoxin system PIN domain toxin